MLYSFDIDGTLFKNDVEKKNNHLSDKTSWDLTKSIIRGDIILINTANNVFTKTKQVVCDVVKPIFEKYETGAKLLNDDEQKLFVDNFNKNFYVALSAGGLLAKLKFQVPSEEYYLIEDENAKDDFIKQNCIIIDRVLYKENITNKTLKQVKELFQKDKIVSKRLDTSKWAYLEMENSTNFADGQKIYSFDEDLPESIKVVFYTKPYEIVYDDNKTNKNQLTKKELNRVMSDEYKYVAEILKESGIDANVNVLWNDFIVIGKVSINKSTPINYLSKMYGLTKDDCIMFGNEKADLIDDKYASTIIVKSADFNLDEQNNYWLADTVEEAFTQGELKKIVSDNSQERDLER